MSKSQALHKLMIVIGLLFILLITMQSQAHTLHHEMQVEIIPGLKMLKAQDTLTFPNGSPRKISFLLHKELKVTVTSPDDTLTLLHPATASEPYAEYGLILGTQDNKVTLNYFGVIFDPIINENSNGLISPEGATLFGETYWYPSFLDTPTAFNITVSTPIEWQSLVQGQLASTHIDGGVRKTRFVEIYPQQDIYLVAGPFFSFENTLKDGKKVRVLLRRDEPALAQTFLAAIPHHLQHYGDIIAPYPYASFSVVENMWETGYGMPSFTLLGPSVIRLPFIINSSLPHEVLHNWWGNSVYVDYEKGNWSEGLTTYMADYWQQEKIGNDRNYRLNMLMTYEDFVGSDASKDFPLRHFRGRHNSSSQAVGYGKSMMVFQMLEFRFGKEQTKKALQNFYTQNIYKRASFEDIQNSFQKITNQDLQSFFDQWLGRTGAPHLQLTDVKVMHWLDGSFSTTYALSQAQEELYDLAVPIVWQLESGEVVRQVARLTEKNQIFSLVTRSKPVKISVDPDFNIFRRLDSQERPVTLSSTLGAPQIHFYHGELDAEAEAFAKVWSKSADGTSFFHSIGKSLSPATQGSIVLVGDHPAFAEFMKEQLVGQSFDATKDLLKIQGQDYLLSDSSTLVAARLKSNPQQTVIWVRWSKDNNPTEWAQRLTHYGSFGILVFKGRPVVLKSTWPVLSSPLQREL